MNILILKALAFKIIVFVAFKIIVFEQKIPFSLEDLSP